MRTHIGSTIPTGAYATAPQARGDRDNSRRARARNDKRKSPPPDEVVRSPPLPKPNFGGLPSPQGQRVRPTEGKPTLLMQPQLLADIHPFTPTLKEWQHGIEVDCGPYWAWDVIEAAVARGPHPTACTAEAIALFEEDIKYQWLAGFCKVIKGPAAAPPIEPQDLTHGSCPTGRPAPSNHPGLIFPGVSRRQWCHHNHAEKCQQHHGNLGTKSSGPQDREGTTMTPYIYARYSSRPPHPYV